MRNCLCLVCGLAIAAAGCAPNYSADYYRINRRKYLAEARNAPVGGAPMLPAITSVPRKADKGLRQALAEARAALDDAVTTFRSERERVGARSFVIMVNRRLDLQPELQPFVRTVKKIQADGKEVQTYTQEETTFRRPDAPPTPATGGQFAYRHIEVGLDNALRRSRCDLRDATFVWVKARGDLEHTSTFEPPKGGTAEIRFHCAARPEPVMAKVNDPFAFRGFRLEVTERRYTRLSLRCIQVQ